METERTEEYLEAIYKRQLKEKPVMTSSLASDLGVSQPAVTDMLRTLDGKGLITYKASRGATLTSTGEEIAVGVIRRHRLWERFLTDVLGMQMDKVHEEACRLEHVTSPEVEQGLIRLLGDIDTCPHGHSIPDAKGNIKQEKTIPLSKLSPTGEVRILTIDNEDAGILKSIDKLGLKPGMIIKILKRNSDGSLDIEVDGDTATLDSGITGILTAEPAPQVSGAEEKREISLGMLSSGETAVIRSCGGGKGSLGRCLSLGFTPGSVVKMVENYNRGPVLVKVRDTEVAIGRELAEKISVIKKEA